MKETDRVRLLRVAREAVDRELRGDSRPVSVEMEFDPPVGGLFVTLRREGRLRGCMGTFDPSARVSQVIDSVARTACNDPRFAGDPISVEEWASIRIEISVLGPLGVVEDPQSLVPGKHGVVVRRGNRSGCFLPQVATEAGWSAEQFLDNCCTTKVGIEAGGWRRRGTEVRLFTAEVFAESAPD